MRAEWNLSDLPVACGNLLAPFLTMESQRCSICVRLSSPMPSTLRDRKEHDTTSSCWKPGPEFPPFHISIGGNLCMLSFVLFLRLLGVGRFWDRRSHSILWVEKRVLGRCFPAITSTLFRGTVLRVTKDELGDCDMIETLVETHKHKRKHCAVSRVAWSYSWVKRRDVGHEAKLG